MEAVFSFLFGWAIKRFATKSLDTLTQETKYDTLTTSTTIEKVEYTDNEIKNKEQ